MPLWSVFQDIPPADIVDQEFFLGGKTFGVHGFEYHIPLIKSSRIFFFKRSRINFFIF